MLKYVPNFLTICRFLLIPIILISIFSGNYLLACILFTSSALTDILDGYIARKFKFISTFGKLMDPLADKLTQISTIAALVVQEIVPSWILIIVLIKELVMVTGASFLYGKNVVVYSKWYGKLATVLFFIAIVFSLILNEFEELHVHINYNLDIPLYCLALVSTIFSLLMYTKAIYSNGFINKDDLNKVLQPSEETKNIKK